MLFFALTLAILFVMDYRRLVMGAPLDFIYWGLGALGLATSFMSAKNLYWSTIVKKTKKSIEKNGGKLNGGFFDAWTSVVAIGLFVYAIASYLATIIISGAFNLTVIRDLFS